VDAEIETFNNNTLINTPATTNNKLLYNPKKLILLDQPLTAFSGLIKHDKSWLDNSESSTKYMIKNFCMVLYVIKKNNINTDDKLLTHYREFMTTATKFTHIIGDINNKYQKLKFPVMSIKQRNYCFARS
jgi:hypothetical protein